MSSPLNEQTVGNAPYEEALAKAKARNLRGGNISLGNIIGRMLQRGALQAALQGLGSVPRGANFGTAFLAGAGGASRAMTALDQQAQLEQYRQSQLALQQAQEARLSQQKPPKEPKPSYSDKRREIEAMLGRPLSEDEARRLGGVYIAPPKPAKGKNPPKPVGEVKLPTEIRTGIRIIRMMDPNNPEHVARLRSLILNPPSEEERRAAETKLNQATRIAPHPGLP